jgi:hypothetical protein
MRVLKIPLLITLFFLIGCQNDELQEKIVSSTQKHKVEQKSLKDFPGLIPVVENMKKIRPKSNVYARTTETFLGVENVITDDIYVYSDSTGYKTYSFKIENIHNTLKFENLHLIETETGFIAYIMSYDPDPSWLEEKKSDPHEEVYMTNYVGEITKYSLEREVIYSTDQNNYTTNSSNGTIVECTISMVPFCFGNGQHDHTNGIDDTCTALDYMVVETCTTYFAGGSSSNGDSNNAGGSTNNPDPCPSGGTTGTVIVGTQPISGVSSGCAPNETVVVSLDSEKPCEHLKKNDLNLELQEKISSLKTKAAIQDGVEAGYTMYKHPGSLFSFSVEYTGDPNGDAKGKEVLLQVGTSSTQSILNVVGFVHCHLDDGSTFKVFSFADLIALAEIANFSTNPSSDFVMYVVTNSGTFAMKVNDKILLKSKLNKMNENEIYYESRFKYHVKMDDDVDDQKLGLLKFINEAPELDKLGVDLFEKDESSNSWNKLTLSRNGLTTIKIPCN